MKRIGALVAAALLVFGAFFVRKMIDGEDVPTFGPRPAKQTLYCDASLVLTCESLRVADDYDVITESPSATFDRLVDASDADADDLAGWVAVGDWAAMVDSSRTSQGRTKLFSGHSLVARTVVVLVARTDRTAALKATCTSVDVRCVGDHAGAAWTELGGDARWGTVIYGQDSADTSRGMACLNAAGSAYFGSTSFATNDIEEDAGLTDWLAGLMDTVPDFDPPSRSNLGEFLTKAGSRSVVCTTEAEAASKVPSSRDAGITSISYPDAPTVVGVISSPAVGDSIDVPSDLDDKLVSDGYRVGDRSPQGAANRSVPKNATLPAAGVQNGIRNLWSEVTQ